jgi:hypothetical protein
MNKSVNPDSEKKDIAFPSLMKYTPIYSLFPKEKTLYLTSMGTAIYSSYRLSEVQKMDLIIVFRE